MIDQKFKPVCAFNELKPGQPRTIEIDDRFVVLVLVDGEVFCIDDICTHDGGTLGDGTVDDHCLACPRHGANLAVAATLKQAANAAKSISKSNHWCEKIGPHPKSFATLQAK